MKKNEDPDVWITNLERIQRIAECGKTIDNNELIMHILYHLPSAYDNINDQYMKDLDDEKEIEMEDLHEELRCQLLDQGNIEKSDDDNDDKIVKEEKALKTGTKNSSRENVVFVEKLVTKVQIVGLGKQIRVKDLQIIIGKRTLRQRVLQVIVTTATRKDIKNQNVIQNRTTTQITQKKSML